MQMKICHRVVGVLALALALAGCGGGGASTSGGNSGSGSPTSAGAPTGLSATAGTLQATVSWMAPTNTGGSAVTSYTVTSSPGAVQATVAAPATTATITGLKAGTDYTFTAVATNAAGNSAPSAPSNAVAVIDVPPSNLTYSSNPAVYTQGTVIGVNSPSSKGGAVVSYSVSPALPAGLTLDTNTGIISGTPTAPSAQASYVVTASNSGGSTQATLALTINGAANTVIAASCSRADVGKAIAAAHNGDIVKVPAGTCTWTTGIDSQCIYASQGYDATLCNADGSVKYLTIEGAGVGQTIITDQVPKNAKASSLIRWDANPNGLSRITGLEVHGTFSGNGSCTGIGTVPNINIVGSSALVRIDHNKFIVEGHCPAMMFGAPAKGYVRGVVDHNFIDVSGTPGEDAPGTSPGFCMFIFDQSWMNVGDWGDNSWAQPDSVGTDQALFVEDNIFYNNESVNWFQYCIDGWVGGRAVVRHNNFRATYFDTHGADSGVRSFRQFEVYDNTWTGPDGVSPWDLKGNQSPAPIGTRGGVGVIFDNTALVTNGTMTGIFSGVYLRAAGLQGNPVYGFCDGTNVWDQNSLSNGYLCLDQTGAGYGQLLNTSIPINTVTGTKTWPHQVADPTYVWNNTINGVTAGGVSRTPGVIVVGRDIINGPRPGYTPYVYPHPLDNAQ